MVKHKCKLCFRNFSNGKALGGHMRSHMNKSLSSSSLSLSPAVQLGFEAESASSPSSFSLEYNKTLNYGLRVNPKRNFRLSDPEFVDTDFVILRDRESETESSRNPTRRRSKRSWKLSFLNQQQFSRKIKFSIHSQENESLSSASETITEEDVAFCLMMLSRDKWKRQQQLYEEEEEETEEQEEEDEEEESYESEEEMKSSKTASMTMVEGRYKCETCNKVLRSYQALGGHRASHKKIKVIAQEKPKLKHHDNKNIITSPNNDVSKKIHECPVCFRIFASGQALGGHKRTHGSSATTLIATTIPNLAKFGDSLIDLNLPAPMNDDEIEDSSVSEAEFVKSH